MIRPPPAPAPAFTAMTHSLCASSTDPFSRIQIRIDTCPNLTFSCKSQGTSSSACSGQGRDVLPASCYPHGGFWFWGSHLSTGSLLYETKPCKPPLTMLSAFPCASGPSRGPVGSPFLLNTFISRLFSPSPLMSPFSKSHLKKQVESFLPSLCFHAFLLAPNPSSHFN